MTLLTILALSASASPMDGTPTYEPTPPPTLNAPAIDRADAEAIEKGVKSWLAKTNVELVQVRVEADGTVHLDGSVASSERKAEVLNKVRGVEDVSAVESELSVVSAKADDGGSLTFPSMGTTDPLAADADTTPEDAVLQALLDSTYVEAREIRVSTTDEGHIQLSGSVESAAHRDAAERIARDTTERAVDVNLRIRP